MINVMVIEDRILTLNALKSQVPWSLKEINPVGFFTNCQDAIKQIDDLRPDVIISDIVMPGMDGLSFCEYINGLERNIKMIIISAYSKFEYAKKGIQLGVYDFLEKPVDYDHLCKIILEAGREKQREEQVQNIYRNIHNYGDKDISDYSGFDDFEKRLADCLRCGDFAGIKAICSEIPKYMEQHRIIYYYLQFFVTDFLSTRVNEILPHFQIKDLVKLAELNELVYVSDILVYFEKVLMSVCDEVRRSAAKDIFSTVQKIKSYIEQNYREENLGLSEIAKAFNMSPNYISRIFKEETGSTLTNYINRLKIFQAKKLLVETDKKIGEISSDLGYSSQYYFSMGFKKTTGYSPKEYRNIKLK